MYPGHLDDLRRAPRDATDLEIIVVAPAGADERELVGPAVMVEVARRHANRREISVHRPERLGLDALPHGVHEGQPGGVGLRDIPGAFPRRRVPARRVVRDDEHLMAALAVGEEPGSRVRDVGVPGRLDRRTPAFRCGEPALLVRLHLREAEGDALFVGGRIHHDEGAVLGPLFADGRVKARVGVPAAVPKVDLSFLGRTSPVVAPGGIKPEPAVARLHELQERFLHDTARAGRLHHDVVNLPQRLAVDQDGRRRVRRRAVDQDDSRHPRAQGAGPRQRQNPSEASFFRAACSSRFP